MPACGGRRSCGSPCPGCGGAGGRTSPPAHGVLPAIGGRGGRAMPAGGPGLPPACGPTASHACYGPRGRPMPARQLATRGPRRGAPACGPGVLPACGPQPGVAGALAACSRSPLRGAGQLVGPRGPAELGGAPACFIAGAGQRGQAWGAPRTSPCPRRGGQGCPGRGVGQALTRRAKLGGGVGPRQGAPGI